MALRVVYLDDSTGQVVADYPLTQVSQGEGGEDPWSVTIEPGNWVRQTLPALTPYSAAVSGVVTDSVLVSISSGFRIRLVRNAGHVDPALAEDTYPLVTLKIGSTVVYQDKLEAGLPWAETVCFEGADGDDLTITIDQAATLYLNLRYEIVAA